MPGKIMRRSPFGIEVKTELVRLGKSSRELAFAVGLAESTLCDVIAGRNQCDRTKQKIQTVLERWKEEENRIQIDSMK